MRKVFVILIGSLALATAYQEADSMLTVKTTNGYVRGVLKESCRTEKPFAAFRGIPYAEPPVGKLRFRDPVPVRSWDGVWDATYQRSSCMQNEDPKNTVKPSSEDCLYLNVYTPNVKYLKYSEGPPKAVMVFIHPGAFTMGDSGERFYSPDFLVDQDVVLVTFNYRLGAFGFLSLQNRDVPGNAGLKDQNLVLKWVKANIEKFGGDPSRITIFGQSAGAASVNYHILSNSSAGLFHNAIMQSGVSIAPWAYASSKLSLKKSMNLAKMVGCNKRNSAAVLRCLQQVPGKKITKVQEAALTLQELFTLRIIAFQPTTEPNFPGAFLPEHPYDVLNSGNFSKVPTIIGMTADEGFFLLEAINKTDPYGILMGALSLDLSRFVPYNFHVMPFTKAALLAHTEISKFYFSGNPPSMAWPHDISDLITDTMFTLPIQLTTSLFAQKSVPLYNYLFSYDGDYNVMKIAQDMTNFNGVFHGDDLGYLFYVKNVHNQCGNRNISRSPNEIMISRMTKMWTNFAKTGNPNFRKAGEVQKKWEKFTMTERSYLDIDEDLVPSDSLKLANVLFWDDLLTKLIDLTMPGIRTLIPSIWKILL